MPPERPSAELDKVKAQVSLFILSALLPELSGLGALFGDGSGGLAAGIKAMFNESSEGLAGGGAGKAVSSGGKLIDSELSAGETISGGAGSSGIESSVGANTLRAQEAADDIANGHAFEKHVVQQGEYSELGISTREEFSRHIEDVVNKPTAFRELSGGRSAYWDESSGTVVIRNPKAVDGGTAFRPAAGRDYFDKLR